MDREALGRLGFSRDRGAVIRRGDVGTQADFAGEIGVIIGFKSGYSLDFRLNPTGFDRDNSRVGLTGPPLGLLSGQDSLEWLPVFRTVADPLEDHFGSAEAEEVVAAAVLVPKENAA